MNIVRAGREKVGSRDDACCRLFPGGYLSSFSFFAFSLPPGNVDTVSRRDKGDVEGTAVPVFVQADRLIILGTLVARTRRGRDTRRR
jgi:hypothetical protein